MKHLCRPNPAWTRPKRNFGVFGYWIYLFICLFCGDFKMPLPYPRFPPNLSASAGPGCGLLWTQGSPRPTVPRRLGLHRTFRCVPCFPSSTCPASCGLFVLVRLSGFLKNPKTPSWPKKTKRWHCDNFQDSLKALPDVYGVRYP